MMMMMMMIVMMIVMMNDYDYGGDHYDYNYDTSIMIMWMRMGNMLAIMMMGSDGDDCDE